MHILQVNKYYYVNGGGDRYFIELSRNLRHSGQQTAIFAMNDSNNFPTSWSKYFVSSFHLKDIGSKEFLQLGKIIYSREARKKIAQLLDHFPAQIAHIHSIYHHLSPSILPEFYKREIPVVMSVHDYHLISPNYNLFHHGKICEITKKQEYYKAIYHKCVRDSHLLSTAEVVEKYMHLLLGWERKMIKFFLAPSRFMQNKLIEYGIEKNKVIHLPYFIDLNRYKADYRAGDYVLYFGRLSQEKGLEFLIEAFRNLPGINLVIAGSGPVDRQLQLMVKKSGISNIKFSGYLDFPRLEKAIQGCRFTVLPSLWFDVAPLSVLESFASGKPVIASNIGGIPETVKQGLNGFLFKPGDSAGFTDKINYLWERKNLTKQLGQNARRQVEEHFGFENHYKRLMAIYQNLLTIL